MKEKGLVGIALCILLLLFFAGSAGYYLGFQKLNLNSYNSQIPANKQSTINENIVDSNEPKFQKITSQSGIPDTNWRVYYTTEFTVNLPEYWRLYKNTVEPFSYGIYYGSLPDEPRACSILDDATINIYRSSNLNTNTLWMDKISQDKFYDIDNTFWTKEMTKSGGGGILDVKFSLTTIGNKKAIKQTKTWTEGYECWDRVETNYYMLSNKKFTDGKYEVIIVQTNQNIKSSKYNEISENFNKIIKTLVIFDLPY